MDQPPAVVNHGTNVRLGRRSPVPRTAVSLLCCSGSRRPLGMAPVCRQKVIGDSPPTASSSSRGIWVWARNSHKTTLPLDHRSAEQRSPNLLPGSASAHSTIPFTPALDSSRGIPTSNPRLRFRSTAATPNPILAGRSVNPLATVASWLATYRSGLTAQRARI